MPRQPDLLVTWQMVVLEDSKHVNRPFGPFTFPVCVLRPSREQDRHKEWQEPEQVHPQQRAQPLLPTPLVYLMFGTSHTKTSCCFHAQPILHPLNRNERSSEFLATTPCNTS